MTEFAVEVLALVFLAIAGGVLLWIVSKDRGN